MPSSMFALVLDTSTSLTVCGVASFAADSVREVAALELGPPAKAGEYKSWWRMANPKGSAFGLFFSVWIIIR